MPVFPGPPSCTEILQQTPLLVHCEISLSYLDDDQEPDTELPILQSFILVEYAQSQTPYLHSLALRVLQISELDLETDPIAGLAFFISKSRCTLQELRITGLESVVAPTAYRTAFPTIPKLTFRNNSEIKPGFVSGQ